MCFSATASFTAGAILLVIGIGTLRSAGRRNEIAFATIPLLFGIQQLVEGLVWLSFRPGGAAFNPPLTFTYSIFSHVLWPAFVPVAVLLMERDGWRRTTLGLVVVIGAAVAAYLLFALVSDGITSSVVGGRIVYRSTHFYVAVVLAAYFSATCASLMISSHKWVTIFGILALAAAAVAVVVSRLAFISVWCFFAAVLSAIVWLHLVHGAKPQRASS